MCMYVAADWRDCEHTQFLGSQHCGMDTKAKDHQYVSNYFRESGFDCELCLVKDGKTIDPDDVKYYPPTNLKVTVITDWKGFKTVIPRPQHRRNWNSLSDAGSEGSCSSITARMCGIDLSHKTKPNEVPDESVSMEHLANGETPTINAKGRGVTRETTTEGLTGDTSTERRASHGDQNTVNSKGAPVPDVELSIENAVRLGQQAELQKHRALLDSQLKALPQHVAHAEHHPEQAELAKHRSLLESQLKNLQHHITHTELQPKLAPVNWVQAPVFQPAVLAAPVSQYTPWGPITSVRNTWTAASNYTPVPSAYMAGMPQPQIYMVVPADPSCRLPPPLQVTDSSTSSTPAPTLTSTDAQLPLKPVFGPVAPLSTQPQVALPRSSFQFGGPSRAQGQIRSVNHASIRRNLVPGRNLLSRGASRPSQPRDSMPVCRLSLADLMVRFDGKGNRRKASREVKLGTTKEGEGKEKGEEMEVGYAGNKEEGMDEVGDV